MAPSQMFHTIVRIAASPCTAARADEGVSDEYSGTEQWVQFQRMRIAAATSHLGNLAGPCAAGLQQQTMMQQLQM